MEFVVTHANFKDQVVKSKFPVLLLFYLDGEDASKEERVELSRYVLGRDDIAAGCVCSNNQNFLTRLFQIKETPTIIVVYRGTAVDGIRGPAGRREIDDLVKKIKKRYQIH